MLAHIAEPSDKTSDNRFEFGGGRFLSYFCTGVKMSYLAFKVMTYQRKILKLIHYFCKCCLAAKPCFRNSDIRCFTNESAKFCMHEKIKQNSFKQVDYCLRGMILKFWSWRDISVASNATCLIIVPNNNIFFVYTRLWQVKCNLKERPENYPRTTIPSMHWPIRQTVHIRDLWQEQSQQFIFMAAQCSYRSQYALYIWWSFYMILDF